MVFAMSGIDGILTEATGAIRPLLERAFAIGREIGYREGADSIRAAMSDFLMKRVDIDEHIAPVGTVHEVEIVDSLTLSGRASPGSVKPVLLEFIRNHPGVTMNDLQEQTGIKPNSVRGTVWSLQKEGLVIKQGNGFAISTPASAGNGNPGAGSAGED